MPDLRAGEWVPNGDGRGVQRGVLVRGSAGARGGDAADAGYAAGGSVFVLCVSVGDCGGAGCCVEHFAEQAFLTMLLRNGTCGGTDG